MAEEKRICPSCGSALPDSVTLCDLCGEELAAQPVEDVKSAAAPPARPSRQQNTKAVKKEKSPAGRPEHGAALFTTTQWVIICVASMVLGAVLTASFLPSVSGTDTPDQANVQNGPPAAQQPQIDLERLNQLRAYIDQHPDDDETRLRYANELHDANLTDQAIVQYIKYLEGNPDNPDARVDLGICYFELQQYANAIREMETAVARHPDHQLGHYNLGIVNLNAGNVEAAREWFIKARDIDPSSSYGINAKQLLESEFDS